MSSSLFIGLVLSLLYTHVIGQCPEGNRRGRGIVPYFYRNSIKLVPYHISISQQLENGIYVHRCSGVLVRENLIFSEDGCVLTVMQEGIKLVVFLLDQRQELLHACNIANYISTRMELDIAKLHGPNYTYIGYAQITVECPMEFRGASSFPEIYNHVGPINPGAQAIVSGWKAVNETVLWPTMAFTWEKVPVLNSSECSKYYAVKEGEICAGNPETDPTLVNCSGDIGSPLMLNGRLVGIRFCGFGGKRPRSLGVYQMYL